MAKNIQFSDMDNKGNPMKPAFPASGGKSLDKAGIADTGYITKKGTPSGKDAMFNYLPPGENIEAQECADIRPEPMKTLVDLGYLGDGWGGDEK